MFGKKKKQTNSSLSHPRFGEMKYEAIGWTPPFTVEMNLWNRTYDISICFLAEKEEEIDPRQETAFERFGSIIVEQREEIERKILEYSGEGENENEAGERFIPGEVNFSRKGECALFFTDTSEDGFGDDLYDGFAMFLIPRLVIDAPESCFDCLAGFADFSTRRDL